MAIELTRGEVETYLADEDTLIHNPIDDLLVEWQTDGEQTTWIPLVYETSVLVTKGNTIHLQSRFKDVTLAVSKGIVDAPNNIAAFILNGVAVNVPINVKSFSIGGGHSAIIKEDGTVWTTGKNSHGQLGVGEPDRPYETMFKNTGHTAIQVSCGLNHTVILKEDGTVWACGDNTYGQLGLGEDEEDDVFENTGHTAIEISAGGNNTFIIKVDETLWCTGKNGDGQLGLGDEQQREMFTDTGVTECRFVSNSITHTVIGVGIGSLYATGNNDHGQLGQDGTENSKVFLPISSPVTEPIIQDISCGENFTMVIVNHQTFSCGKNNHGQLGLGTTRDRHTLVDTGETNCSQVACGNNHVLLLMNNGDLKGAGYSDKGQLGQGTEDLDYINFITLTPGAFNKISVGLDSSMVTSTVDNNLWVTGDNITRQLGVDHDEVYEFTDAEKTLKE